MVGKVISNHNTATGSCLLRMFYLRFAGSYYQTLFEICRRKEHTNTQSGTNTGENCEQITLLRNTRAAVSEAAMQIIIIPVRKRLPTSLLPAKRGRTHQQMSARARARANTPKAHQTAAERERAAMQS